MKYLLTLLFFLISLPSFAGTCFPKDPGGPGDIKSLIGGQSSTVMSTRNGPAPIIRNPVRDETVRVPKVVVDQFISDVRSWKIPGSGSPGDIVIPIFVKKDEISACQEAPREYHLIFENDTLGQNPQFCYGHYKLLRRLKVERITFWCGSPNGVEVGNFGPIN